MSGGSPVGSQTRTAAARVRDLGALRRVLQMCAVLTIGGGAAVGLLPLGIETSTARMVSSVLIFVGICDTFVLRFWHRLFRLGA